MNRPRKIPDRELEIQAPSRRLLELEKRERLAAELEAELLVPLTSRASAMRPGRRVRGRKP